MGEDRDNQQYFTRKIYEEYEKCGRRIIFRKQNSNVFVAPGECMFRHLYGSNGPCSRHKKDIRNRITQGKIAMKRLNGM